LIEVGPFLELEGKGSSGHVLNSDRDWMRSVERWRSHNDNRAVKLILNTNSVPKIFVRLVDLNSAELNDSITSDFGEESVLVQVALSEVHPGSAITSEGPRSRHLRKFGDVEDLEDMVTSRGVHAESEVLGLLGRSHTLYDLTVPKNLGTVVKVDWKSEAVEVIGSRRNVHESVESDIFVGSVLADGLIGNLAHVLHDLLTVTSGRFSIIERRVELGLVLNGVLVEVACSDIN
jgi:hypothetical protein